MRSPQSNADLCFSKVHVFVICVSHVCVFVFTCLNCEVPCKKRQMNTGKNQKGGGRNTETRDCDLFRKILVLSSFCIVC